MIDLPDEYRPNSVLYDYHNHSRYIVYKRLYREYAIRNQHLVRNLIMTPLIYIRMGAWNYQYQQKRGGL